MFDELFSCRNCIHNAGQSIHIGPAHGYCVLHQSVLREPEDTTCKYLHRKDLPGFVVDEARREHAAEFVEFSFMASLSARKPLFPLRYSEKYCWEQRSFDAVNHALAQYQKAGKSWVYVQAFAGSTDGRRALLHGGLVRRYMARCGTWVSSYRLVLALVNEFDVCPVFNKNDLRTNGNGSIEIVEEEARWDVFFARLSGLQEYGWHAGLDELIWASDTLNGGLSDLDWSRTTDELHRLRPVWTDMLVKHASDEGVFFDSPDTE